MIYPTACGLHWVNIDLKMGVFSVVSVRCQ